MLPSGGVFSATLVDRRDGFVAVLFEGRGAKALFADEGGGHRWQRVPPNDKRGRRHTSTVTVAVMQPVCDERFELDRSEVEIRATRGSGPGGQHRNKTDSCIVATHLPTSLSVRVDMKSQHQSRAMALQILAAKVADRRQAALCAGRDSSRRQQVGSGMRGDKIRTYREQDDRVVDHQSGRSWRLKDWKRGIW